MILMKNFDNMKRWIKSIVLASQMKLWPETLQPQGLWSMFTHTHTHTCQAHAYVAMHSTSIFSLTNLLCSFCLCSPPKLLFIVFAEKTSAILQKRFNFLNWSFFPLSAVFVLYPRSNKWNFYNNIFAAL